MAKISNTQLIPNKSVIVRGKITFSHVTRKIEGEELIRRNQGTNYPENRPYTEIAIGNATVIPESGDGNNLSINEQYIVQKCYMSKSHPERGWCFSAKNKGNNLPNICQGEGEDTISGKAVARQITPNGELANDLDVTLVLRVFQGKPNPGISLDTVIVNEPIRYYDGASQIAMASRGIKFIGDDAAKAAAQGNSYYAVPEAPATPVQEPVSQPAANTNMFSSQAQAAAAAAQPASAPVQTTAQTAAPIQENGTPFPMNQPEAAPTAAPVAGPVAGTTTAQQPAGPVAGSQPTSSPVKGGIIYDPNQRNY